ncbi:MAG TPA: PilZ domain-containing protein [Terriglobales bacterium]|nr:PilZ domain-containing protein [Terriglobales bacterium]
MTLQALVVSKDDDAADVLSRVFAGFGVAVERFSEPEIALQRLAEQRFDCLVVDFDEADTARHLLETVPNGKPGVIIPMALLSQESDVRKVLSGGAKFILRKPLQTDQTASTLRAVTALLRRERRRSFRVPVQAPAQLSLAGGDPIEGIMLDLSQTGMDVLAAQPLHPAALIGIRFELPDGSAEIDVHAEVAWANPNGQSGVRFLDMPEPQVEKLKAWLLANSPDTPLEEPEPVSVCKLTDLSLGGCYVETESPFPEQALVDLCLKAGGMEIHADGMVRVMHPSSGMGVEFPSHTNEQRETVAKFIEFLTSQPGTVPELLISPKSLMADPTQFDDPSTPAEERPEDPLLELLRNGHSLERERFLAELQRQRNPEAIASN